MRYTRKHEASCLFLTLIDLKGIDVRLGKLLKICNCIRIKTTQLSVFIKSLRKCLSPSLTQGH